MSGWDENHVPPEFDEIEHRLRAYSSEASPLDLDRIKLQAKARASASRPKGSRVRSRLVAGIASLGLLVGGTGGVLAESHDGNGNGNGDRNGGDNGEHSAANKQYCDHGSHASQCQRQSHHGSIGKNGHHGHESD